MIAIGSQDIEADRLMQTDVSTEGSVTGGHHHLLPVPGVAAAASLQMLALLLELRGAVEQFLGGLGQFRAAAQPEPLVQREVPEGRQAVKPTASSPLNIQSQHAQGLGQRSG